MRSAFTSAFTLRTFARLENGRVGGRISRGASGIDDVTSSLCHVDVADARAFDPRDEEKVKRTIECTDAWSGLGAVGSVLVSSEACSLSTLGLWNSSKTWNHLGVFFWISVRCSGGIPRFGERTPKSLLIFAQLLGARVVSLFKGWVYVAEMGSQDQRTVGLFSC